MSNRSPIEVGLVVDAGPELGYGHAVRCLRLAAGLGSDVNPVFYPLSQACGRFLAERDFEVRSDDAFPAVMISDISETNPFTDAIASHGCRHISIRDMGLAQCDADVVIDGSITTIDPYPVCPDRETFVGPEYMVIEPRDSVRHPEKDRVFVTLGGGSSSDYTPVLADALATAGFQVDATPGFHANSMAGAQNSAVRWVDADCEIEEAISRCSLAITTSGVSLYEMLAAGVPTIALSVNDYQLETARAFDSHGAVRSMGLLSETAPIDVAERASEVLADQALMVSLVEQGRRLVDGKGLFRVTEIVRSELCPTA